MTARMLNSMRPLPIPAPKPILPIGTMKDLLPEVWKSLTSTDADDKVLA